MFFINITCKKYKSDRLGKKINKTALVYKLPIFSTEWISTWIQNAHRRLEWFLWQHQTWRNCQHCLLWGLGHLPCSLEDQEIMRNSHELKECVGVASSEGSATAPVAIALWSGISSQDKDEICLPCQKVEPANKTGTVHEVKILECVKWGFKEWGKVVFQYCK